MGAGSRGFTYARLARASGRAVVSAVVEPDPDRRSRFAREFALEPSLVFASWAEALRGQRVAEAAVIATPDDTHADPAVAFAEAGYHICSKNPWRRRGRRAGASWLRSSAAG